MQPLINCSRLSLNQITIRQWSLQETIEGCARAGIPAIGIWRDKLGELGLPACRRLLSDTGLRVSSLCRGGFFPAPTAAARQARIDDNRQAIVEAATIGAKVLVLVCGPAPDRDLPRARAMVAEGIAALLPDATAAGVMLGIEPLHPMFAAERSVITTLAEAMRLVRHFNSPAVGVVADAYHIWWDPDLDAQIAQAGKAIVGYHVSDWLVPTPDMLLGRGLMGDGVIELQRMRAAVEATGYQGDIEVEIFNQDLWKLPGTELLDIVTSRFISNV